ncbi:hypothetical protein [Plastoroseomonas hellenica]|uniref:Uncharacterized protein n=1 Tax=Plastoroseomonas hellenica TaxID=2687306 RepID=A0ABS5EXX1_9PROT|nr:hypothetical protein [Plastoroseomonas hellenica]MBR0643117.1 hypothetical protein [Plastoroseomonas hellenica]MBR0665131.1 hypothetical protein [Plastoroseomonas hellenica]
MGWLAAVVALVLILALLHWLEFVSVVPRRWRRAADPKAPRPPDDPPRS